ncbi:MAG: HupE/UreJ family protein [Saprospiraceae bacterium]|nr:HupE/UreJ family protein [Saprospiraceae bacterium]
MELENLIKKPDYLEIENTCLLDVYPNQVNMATVIIDKEMFDVILNKNEPKQTIYLSKSMGNYFKSFYQFAKEGFRHVLPLGLDHILFILALFFLNSNLKSSVIQASMFTLAHSITLILTGLGYLVPNATIIEPLIAFSIFLMAFQNIFYPRINHSRLVLIFLFGLVHGLGFANAFLTLQIPTKLTINALLAFNIGVELAQVFIIFGLYYFLAKWIRNESWYQTYFMITVSFSIGTFALLLTFQRL